MIFTLLVMYIGCYERNCMNRYYENININRSTRSYSLDNRLLMFSKDRIWISINRERNKSENVNLMGYEFISLDPILVDLPYKVMLGSSGVGGVTLRPRV